MAESQDSPLERLRSEINPDKRNECIFSELISRSDQLPLSVAVFADELALQDLQKRKLEVKDVLTGCEDIYRLNGLDFSYAKYSLPPEPAKWVHSPIFSEYLPLGRSVISGACVFEGQDIFLQTKASTVIFLTGHIRVGNGRANDVRSEFRGRGIIVVGTGDYNFFQDIKYQWRSILSDVGSVFLILLGVRTFTNYKILSNHFFESASLIAFTIVTAHFFMRWMEFRMTDYGYTHHLFSTLAHEQGHLFGLEHVDDEESLMFPYGSRTKRFGELSKELLLKILKPIN